MSEEGSIGPLAALTAAFGRFYTILDAATVPDAEGARRVAGIAHAVALSEATAELHTALANTHLSLFARHGTAISYMPAGIEIKLLESDSPDGPWSTVPTSEISMQSLPIGGSGANALLMAALDSATQVAAFPAEKLFAMQAANPGAHHQRWHLGELIRAEDLAALESAAKLLQLHQRECESSECATLAAEKMPRGLAGPVDPMALPPVAAKWLPGGSEVAPKPFQGGTMAYFADRVEFCGVDICSGSRSEPARKALDLLRQKDKKGTYCAYSGDELAQKTGRKAGQNSAAGLIRDLRKRISDVLRSKANIECGEQDVILSGGPGYRLSDRVSVQYDGQATATQITDTAEESDVRNVRNEDVPNVPDDAASTRRAWILQRLGAGDQLQAPFVVKQFACSVKTAQRDLQALKDEGRIEFVGATRTGYYRLVPATQPSR